MFACSNKSVLELKRAKLTCDSTPQKVCFKVSQFAELARVTRANPFVILILDRGWVGLICVSYRAEDGWVWFIVHIA